MHFICNYVHGELNWKRDKLIFPCLFVFLFFFWGGGSILSPENWVCWYKFTLHSGFWILPFKNSKINEEHQQEMSILSERRFVVGENEILELLKRSTCKLCGDPIIPSSITEAEKIAAGIKYKFKCTVSITWMYNAFQIYQLPLQLNKWSKRFLKLNILVHNLVCKRGVEM